VARLRLCHELEIPSKSLRRSGLWAPADDGEAGLQTALACHDNRRLLCTLAGLPDDSRGEWTMREVGGAGSVDVVALLTGSSGGSVLLLVDCRAASHASPAHLREQMATATRMTLATLASISLRERPSWTKLILLNGWRKGVPEPKPPVPLPGLQREPAILESVPEPQLWGYLPFVSTHRESEIFVALGRCEELDEEPWRSLDSARSVAGPRLTWAPMSLPSFGDAFLELEERVRCVRVSLRLKANTHKAALKKGRHGSTVVSRLQALRAACYSGLLDVGAGRFVGETIDDGCPRLHWEWAEGQAPSAESARTKVAEALLQFK